ncbi:hemerythrin domain-containing protein [Methylibium sp.]|uniref:hemerythrin domain-containing protein n=1 Tax=Methylibium sp. TaxID=2067992 RepID=UPI003D13C437
MSSAFPGFSSPAAGFEQPFELLLACHERVRRSLGLLGRLIEHIAAHGHDAKSRSAAADVLRYFDVAAPLHHQDEELHVFAVLAGSGNTELATRVAGLRGDHLRMEALWGELRAPLLAWAQPDAAGAVDAAVRQCAAEFERLYAAHLQTEEGIVFPAARARLDAAQLAAMSACMQRRRRVP